MKRSFFSVWVVASLVVSVYAYARDPAAQATRPATTPKVGVVPSNGLAKSAPAPKVDEDTKPSEEVAPAAAVRLMVLRWLVTR